MASLPKSATSADQISGAIQTKPQPGTLTTGIYVPAAGQGTVEHGQSKFPPFDPGSFVPQLIWLALSFSALYILMSRLALPRIGGVLAERSDRIQRDLSEAERMKTETDAALKAYEQSLSDARGKAQTIAKDTRDKLAVELERDRHSSDQQNAMKIADMEKQIAETKFRALANVNDIAADTAASIVAKLLGREIPMDEIRKALKAG